MGLWAQVCLLATLDLDATYKLENRFAAEICSIFWETIIKYPYTVEDIYNAQRFRHKQ